MYNVQCTPSYLKISMMTMTPIFVFFRGVRKRQPKTLDNAIALQTWRYRLVLLTLKIPMSGRWTSPLLHWGYTQKLPFLKLKGNISIRLFLCKMKMQPMLNKKLIHRRIRRWYMKMTRRERSNFSDISEISSIPNCIPISRYLHNMILCRPDTKNKPFLRVFGRVYVW